MLQQLGVISSVTRYAENLVAILTQVVQYPLHQLAIIVG